MSSMKRCLVSGAWCVGVAVAIAVPAHAQQGSLDPRWQPWLGCWEPVPPDGQVLPVDVPRTCVIPAAGASAVEFLAVADGRVVSRERVEASAERREISAENCSGWERASWSDEGLRLYRRSEHTCPDAPLRRVTSLTSIAQNGEWLDVQSVSAGRGSVVRVRRFREAPAGAILPDEVRAALQDLMLAATAARTAASARLQLSDVVEAVANADSTVVEAWLAATGQGFELDGRRLAQLAGDGMTGGVIDMMVALSYPKAFVVSTTHGAQIAVRDSARAGGGALYPSIMNTTSSFLPASYSNNCSRYGWDPYGMGYGWEYDNRYDFGTYSSGCGYGYGYGNGYGYGWNWGSRPVIVVVGSAGAGSAPRGRVINGRGYSSGKPDGTSASVARPSDASGSGSTRAEGGGGSSASSGGYSGGSGGGTSGGGSGTSSSEGRTAKPRP